MSSFPLQNSHQILYSNVSGLPSENDKRQVEMINNGFHILNGFKY